MLWPSKETKEAVQWAKDNEHLDSTLVALMNQRVTDVASWHSRTADIGRMTLAEIEKRVVRIPTFLAFEYALRDVFPNKIERYEAAAQQLYYVVNYSRESSPLVYAKNGLLGEAARPMKQYSHNYFGQFLEYWQGMKDYKEYSPLAMFYGNQVLMVGLRGALGFAEATAIITLINNALGSDIMTPEQYLLKSGASDSMVFGGPSTMLGYDISSSMNSPTIPQMFSFFPVEVGAQAAKNVLDYLYKLSVGRATEKDQMEAALSVTPAAMAGWIQNYYTKPGQPVPHPGMDMKGTHVRTETEKSMATLWSLKSTSEARHDAEARVFKQLFAMDVAQKMDVLSIMADRVATKQKLEPWMIHRYMAEGGDMSQLTQAIQKRMLQRMVPYNQSQLMGPGMSQEKMHKLDIMKDALNRQVLKDRKPGEKEESGYKKMAWDADVKDAAEEARKDYGNAKSKEEAARIRANEVGNKLNKMEEKVQLFKNELAKKGLSRFQRDTLRREMNHWEDAKEFADRPAQMRIRKMGDVADQVTPDPSGDRSADFTEWVSRMSPQEKQQLFATLRKRGYATSQGVIRDPAGRILYAPNIQGTQDQMKLIRGRDIGGM